MENMPVRRGIDKTMLGSWLGIDMARISTQRHLTIFHRGLL